MKYSNISKLFLAAIFISLTACTHTPDKSVKSFHPELAYFEQMQSYGPHDDLRIPMLLGLYYINARQETQGIEFFEHFLEQYEEEFSSEQRSVVLSAYALIKASYTDRVPFYAKIGWLSDTSDIIRQALEANNNQSFIAHWAAGIIYAQIPSILGYQDQALEHLNWCIAHAKQEPVPGFIREVYYSLAKVYHERDQQQTSDKYLRLSGHPDLNKSNLQISPLVTGEIDGSSFYPRQQIVEIVPDRVFVARGFGYSEIYYVISENRKELIGIGAGTHPDSLKAAYHLFKQTQPDSPALSSVFITHAHWDHIGGHEFYRSVNPALKFYNRSNFHDTSNKIIDHEPKFKYFRGKKFSNGWIQSFKPDVTVDTRTKFTIGETEIELIPVPGGETNDGLFVLLPQLRVIFTGDFIMPYFGDAWVEEGDVAETLPAIEVIINSKAETVLHGHFGLTDNFSIKTMPGLYYSLAWLNKNIMQHLAQRTTRADIHRLNLVPPALSDYPDAMIPYLILREGAINRLYDQHVGIWGPDLHGVDYIGQTEFDHLFSFYLDLSTAELSDAIEKMVDNGDYALALKVLQWSEPSVGDDKRIQSLKRVVLEKLKEKYQFLSPFKFFLYSNLQGVELPFLHDFEAKERARNNFAN
jgi:glyoxylase-like metal-dependent hydrolase (beta-lactamase superfamily II)